MYIKKSIERIKLEDISRRYSTSNVLLGSFLTSLIFYLFSITSIFKTVSVKPLVEDPQNPYLIFVCICIFIIYFFIGMVLRIKKNIDITKEFQDCVVCLKCQNVKLESEGKHCTCGEEFIKREDVEWFEGEKLDEYLKRPNSYEQKQISELYIPILYRAVKKYSFLQFLNTK